jgi:membrane-associated phospholipid phosphatase
VTRPRSWWPDALFLGAFVLLTVLLWRGHLLGIDTAVANWSAAHRPPVAYWTARVLNSLGQGGWFLMPIGGALTALVMWRLRSWRPALVFVATAALLYLTVGPMKLSFDRAAPAFTGPDREVLFNPAATGSLGMSYPSGHVANTVLWYAVFAYLLSRLVTTVPPALRVVPPVIVICTTTYLGWHWITDSIAGLFIGLVLARLMLRVPWDRIITPSDRPASHASPATKS